MKFTALFALVAVTSAVKVGDWVGPAHFQDDAGDLFMRSVYKNYSTEGTDKDTKLPTGVWTISEAQGKALAGEVLATHKGLTGKAAADYLTSYWAKAWGHFDVNRTGAIPPLYAPQLMRFLLSDQYVQL